MKGAEAVAVDDQRADCLALAPQRRAGHRAGAGRARRRQAWPVRYRGIDIIEVGHMDLPVLATTVPGMFAPRSRWVPGRSRPVRCELGPTRMVRSHSSPSAIRMVALVASKSWEVSASVAARFSIAVCIGDDAQNLGADGFTIPGGGKFALQPGFSCAVAACWAIAASARRNWIRGAAPARQRAG